MAISGAPVYTVHHADYMTEFAFSIIDATSKINDPSTNNSLKIRVGKGRHNQGGEHELVELI